MAKIESGSSVQVRDGRPLGEKVYDVPKKTNWITIPVGGAVLAGAFVVGAPIVAAGALAGIGGDYMIGEMSSEHGQRKTVRRIVKQNAEKYGTHMSDVSSAEQAPVIDELAVQRAQREARLQANQGEIPRAA